MVQFDDDLTPDVTQDISWRLIHRSVNGDTWLLVKDTSGDVVVEHQPNEPSGGEASRIAIRDFLAKGGSGPEHQELLRLIGTLTDQAEAGPETS